MPRRRKSKGKDKGEDDRLFPFDAAPLSQSGEAPSGPSAAGNALSSRPKRRPKATTRFDQQNFSNSKKKASTKVGQGFDCPRCEAVCTYDSRECHACGLNCYYEAGIGVVRLKDRPTPKAKKKGKGRTPKRKGGGKGRARSTAREAGTQIDGTRDKGASRSGSAAAKANAKKVAEEVVIDGTDDAAKEAGTEIDGTRGTGGAKAKAARKSESVEEQAKANAQKAQKAQRSKIVEEVIIDATDDEDDAPGNDAASGFQTLDSIAEDDSYNPTESNNSFVAIHGAVQRGRVRATPRKAKAPKKSELLARIKELESEAKGKDERITQLEGANGRLTTASRQIEELKADKKQLEDKNEAANRQIVGLKADKKQLEEGNDTLRDANGELEEKNETARQQMEELKADKKQLVEDKESMLRQIRSAEERADKEAREKSRINAKFEELREQFDEYHERMRPIIKSFARNGSARFPWED